MKKEVILVFGLILIIGLVSADVTVSNYSIKNSYGPGQNISGWVDISLHDQESNSVLESSLMEQINLIDLLKKDSNSGFSYMCNPSECTSNYVGSNGESEKTFDLGENESVIFGIKIPNTENSISDVTKLSFNVTSNNPETEKFPLSMDILNDGQTEWNAYTPSGNFGAENFGCYVELVGGTSQANIAQIQYCETVSLSKTPAAEIGAYVKGSEYAEFEMSIRRTDGVGTSKTCTTTAPGSATTQRIGCVPYGFSVKNSGDYLVCIKTTSAAYADEYKINYEQNNPCGFTGNYDGTYDYDFAIFARPEKYASSINFTLNDDELKKSDSPVTNAEIYIENYITTMYNNDCSDGCVIPIKIFSGVDQQIHLSGSLFTYVSGISTETRDFYDVQETPAKISSESQRLYLDESGFHAPDEYGNYTFSVNLEGTELFSKEISVGEVPTIKSITPTTTAIKYPTTFSVDVESSTDIIQYTWDFEGEASQVTTSNSITHTYDEIGKYKLTVTVQDSDGKVSSKDFSINVGPASEIVPSLLDEAETNLGVIKNQITSFSEFERRSINHLLNLDETEAEITKLKKTVSNAQSESDYELVLKELLQINLPKSIAKTTSSDGITFYPENGNINIGVLSKITGQTYSLGKEKNYQSAVLTWEANNLVTTMGFSEISLVYKSYETSLKIFNLGITNMGSNAYLIIKKMDSLFFGGDYSEREEGDYYYMDVGTEKNVLFSTIENVDFVTVPMFIAPDINSLSLTEITPFEEQKSHKWLYFTLIMIGILFVALAVWTFLQMWYKRKYENSLFKNRNNLLNLVSFIEGEKEKNTSDEDIIAKLKKSGWNSEQVTYAIKRYEGKNTGLPELIPIGKIIDSVKKIFQKKATPKIKNMGNNPQTNPNNSTQKSS